jgi:hypothetical protein
MPSTKCECRVRSHGFSTTVRISGLEAPTAG